MRKRTQIFVRVGVVILVFLLNISSISAMTIPGKNSLFCAKNITMTPTGCSRGETELKYYNEEGLSTVIGIPAGGLIVWKSAIRLTQDEMAAYSGWTMTKVNVAFSTDNGCPWLEVRIFIYEKGTAGNPGPLIVNDTTYILNMILRIY